MGRSLEPVDEDATQIEHIDRRNSRLMERKHLPRACIFTCIAVITIPPLFLASLAAETGPTAVAPRSVEQHRTIEGLTRGPGPIGRGSLPLPPEVTLPRIEPDVLEALQRTNGPSWLGPNRSIANATGTVEPATPIASVFGIWLQVEPGKYLWRTTIRSTGASAVRAHFEDFNVDGRVYVYETGSDSQDPYLGPYEGQGPQADGDFWSDLVSAERITVEFLPADQSSVPTAMPFAIREIAHIINLVGSSISASDRKGVYSSPIVESRARRIVGCHLDVSCYSEWQDRDYPSTVLLVMTKSDGTYSCTGVLINTRYETNRHLLMLTAAHCIGEEETASNTVIYWDYQTTECYGSLPYNYSFLRTYGGKLVLAKGPDRSFDFSLIRLDAQEVYRVTGVRRMGWDPNYVSTNTDVINVSHPTGAFKRIAFGRTTIVSWNGLSSSGFGSARWDRGTTEGGSSGSGVFLDGGYLIGIMGGSSRDVEPCDLEYRTYYNRFDRIYPEIESFLESEESLDIALDSFRPQLIHVRLGLRGGTVTLMTTKNGGYTLDGRIFVSGMSVIGEGRREYRLTLDAYGNWQATFVPRNVIVPLGTSGESLTLVSTEDGTLSLNQRSISSGDIISLSSGRQYRLAQGTNGTWIATYIPATIRVALGASGDTVEIRTTESGGYTIGESLITSGTSIIVESGDKYTLTLDDEGLWTATLETGSIEVFLTPSTRLLLERDPIGRFLYDDLTVVAGSVLARGSGDAYRLDRSNDGDWVATPFLGNFQHSEQRYDIETLVGVGVYGYGGDNSRASTALIANPYHVATDPQGNVLVSDSGNHRVRRIDSQGIIRTIVGTGHPGFAGDGGLAANAQLRNPRGIHVDSNGTLYIVDAGNHRIRKVHTSGTIATLAGTGLAGFNGDDRLATTAQLSNPSGVTTDQFGNVFIADSGNHRIRMISGDYISTVAGIGTGGFSGDDGPAISASLQVPTAITTDLIGNVYFADMLNHRVRYIDIDGGITTVLGTGLAGYSGDGHTNAHAQINTPAGIAWDWSSGLYVVDRKVNVVRAVDPRGIVSTVGGSRMSGSGGDGGPAKLAQLNSPTGITLAEGGKLLIADTRNHRVRRLTPRRQVIPPHQVPTQSLVALGDSGQSLRLWRTGNRFDYFGEPISSGDTVYGWNGERYRLSQSATGRWQASLIPTNFAEAATEYRQDALRGDANAQFELGWLYFQGLGVAEDNAVALRWFTLASAQGHAESQTALGVIYREGYGVVVNPLEALNWFRRSANQGSPSGLHYLGMMFYNGEGVIRNASVAAQFFRLAAFADHDEAQLWLGFLFESGNGVPQSYEQSIKWYLLSAEQGNPNSQTSLGSAYYFGKGVSGDYAQAAQWFSRAAQQGYPNAQSFLGFLYTQGHGVARNNQESVRWFRRAAEQGDAYGQWSLGRAYANGLGVASNPITAHVWLGLAIANGEDRAKSDLSEVESRMSSNEISRAQSLMATCRESGYSSCP